MEYEPPFVDLLFVLAHYFEFSDLLLLFSFCWPFSRHSEESFVYSQI